MTPEERRQAVAALLAENPSMSQRAIAKVVGCSQASIRRDMAALGVFRGSPVIRTGPQFLSLQINDGMTRG
ncbi:MAG: hypothetical protein QOD58_2058, partial [Mycobacterium sp.]|nr:hypothetical protein [Mycobacterium sp.]